MKRIFVAVDISDEARRRAATYIESLRRAFAGVRVGWEKPEKLHLTLKFLGNTGEQQLEGLKTVVEDAAREVSAFRLQILDTGVFPSPRNARVLWIDVRDEKGSLAHLSRILEEQCEKLGFPRENRAFRPHLTIARLREPQKSQQLVEKHLENKFEPVEFEAAEVVIYESKLQPSGSIYQRIAVASFKR